MLYRVILIICVFMLFVSCRRDEGYYVKWYNVGDYKYKTYRKEPVMDSMAFRTDVLERNKLGNCRIILTKYQSRSFDEVERLAKNGDAEAMMELFARGRGENPVLTYSEPLTPEEYKLVNRAASRGNLYGRMFKHYHTGDIVRLTSIAEKSPTAALLLMHMKDRDDGLLASLRRVDAYPLAMAAAAIFDGQGKIHKDAFCEAYYSGCDLYSLKVKYGIMCGLR